MQASERLIDLLPENAIAHERMAYTQYEMANIKDSRNSALKAIELDRYYSPAYSILVNSYTFNEPKSFEEAEKYAKLLGYNYQSSEWYERSYAMFDIRYAENKKLITSKNKKSNINPIWIMRQAGRYLPEFREIRKKNTDFIKLCLNSDLASEITLQPIKTVSYTHLRAHET